MLDSNLHAFAGPADNGKTVVLGDPVDGSVVDPATGAPYASALKLTGALTSFRLTAGKVTGGHDACVDINNLCRNVAVEVAELWPTGQFAATIKGNTVGWALRGRLMCHAKRFAVIVGDWSDQSNLYTMGGVLGITPDDGQPVVVCVLAGTKPQLEPGTGPYVFRFPSPDMPGHDLCVYGYQTLRRWGFYRAEANA